MKVVISIFFAFFISVKLFAYDFEECQRKSKYPDSTVPFDINNNFIEECAPDTLYSWQDMDDVLKLASSSQGYLPIDQALYTWRTPAGTYAYGDVSMRFKLKPDVKFKEVSAYDRDCANFSDEEKSNTVYVVYLNWIKASEYILCDGGPVDSWSYGTAYNLDEINREVRYIDCHLDDFSFDSYLEPYQVAYDQRFGFSVDSSSFIFGLASFWTDHTLTRHIRNIEDIIAADEGRVIYNPDTEIHNRDHFHTDRPSYYTPPSN